MKIFTFILIFLTISTYNFAQVGGISASKLGSITSTTVAPTKIEFEPSFAVSYTKKAWDKEGKEYSLFASSDSTLIESGMAFRMSYGLFENMEVGIIFPSSVEALSLGAKFKLPLDNNFKAALIAGINTPLGNTLLDKKNKTMDNTIAAVGGVVLSYKFTDKFSLDFNTQYQKFTKEVAEEHKGDAFVSCDLGYFVLEKVQACLGVYYDNTTFSNKDYNSSVFRINTGVTIERAKNFILILNAPFYISGKNAYKSTGFGVALTITLD